MGSISNLFDVFGLCVLLVGRFFGLLVGDLCVGLDLRCLFGLLDVVLDACFWIL